MKEFFSVLLLTILIQTYYAIDCHPTCLTCSAPGFDKCITCQTQLLQMATGACSCPQNTYMDSETFSCIDCFQSCQTCDGPKENNCLSCLTKLKRVYNSEQQTCTCENYYYEDRKTLSCGKCDNSCSECIGPLVSDCLSCADAKKTVNTTNSLNTTASSTSTTTGKVSGRCECSEGYLEGKDVCTLCPSRFCQKCRSESPKKCIMCYDSYLLLIDTEECIMASRCPSGYYLDLSNKTICRPCHRNCLDCSGPTADECWRCSQSQHQKLYTVRTRGDESWILEKRQCRCRVGYKELLVSPNPNSLGNATDTASQLNSSSTSAWNTTTTNISTNITNTNISGSGTAPTSSTTNTTFLTSMSLITCEKNEISDAIFFVQIFTIILIILFLLPNLFYINPQLGLRMIELLYMFQFLNFLEIEYPKQLDDFYYIFLDWTMGIGTATLIPSQQYQLSAPSRFENKSFDALYLRNSEFMIIFVIVVLIGYLLIYVSWDLLSDFQSDREINSTWYFRIIRGMKKNFQWSIFFVAIELGVIPTLVFSQLQLWNSSCLYLAEILSYAASMISIIFLAGYFWVIIDQFCIVPQAEGHVNAVLEQLKNTYQLLIQEHGMFPVEWNNKKSETASNNQSTNQLSSNNKQKPFYYGSPSKTISLNEQIGLIHNLSIVSENQRIEMLQKEYIDKQNTIIDNHEAYLNQIFPYRIVSLYYRLDQNVHLLTPLLSYMVRISFSVLLINSYVAPTAICVVFGIWFFINSLYFALQQDFVYLEDVITESVSMLLLSLVFFLKLNLIPLDVSSSSRDSTGLAIISLNYINFLIVVFRLAYEIIFFLMKQKKKIHRPKQYPSLKIQQINTVSTNQPTQITDIKNTIQGNRPAKADGDQNMMRSMIKSPKQEKIDNQKQLTITIDQKNPADEDNEIENIENQQTTMLQSINHNISYRGDQSSMQQLNRVEVPEENRFEELQFGKYSHNTQVASQNSPVKNETLPDDQSQTPTNNSRLVRIKKYFKNEIYINKQKEETDDQDIQNMIIQIQNEDEENHAQQQEQQNYQKQQRDGSEQFEGKKQKKKQKKKQITEDSEISIQAENDISKIYLKQ